MGQNSSKESSRGGGDAAGAGPGSSQIRRPSSLISGGSEQHVGVRHHYRDPDPADVLAFHQREAARRAEREARRGNEAQSRSFFGLGGVVGLSGTSGGEQRRETRQEREARRTERERVAREKERERSMKEEHVDGGYLVTQGVYIGTEDYSKVIVRQLMIERRVAPFWRGLNEHSDSWTEYQLVAASRGLPIPAADEIPPEGWIPRPQKQDQTQQEAASQSLTVPITERSRSYTSDASTASSARLNLPTLSSSQPSSPGLTSTFPLRSRTKSSLASFTGGPANPQEILPQEIQLPKNPYVDGLPLEAYLYRNATECPICFLYYPPYLNLTRCCAQPICSECFVQIKRPDPHPPEHASPGSPEAQAPPADGPENQLVSGPASCPFCVTPEFGITYEAPRFRRGLAYAGRTAGSVSAASTSTLSASPSQDSSTDQGSGSRRRATSLAVDAPSVITTDRIRPDWASKLESARNQAARRSAAATALHTAAYLMGGMGGESRFGAFGRRSRRDGPSFGLPRDPAAPQQRGYFPPPGSGTTAEGANGSSEGRDRSRIEELDNMMMAEAIRLSLATEAERMKKQEKEAKKEAKKENKTSTKDTLKRLIPHSSKASQDCDSIKSMPLLSNESRTSFGSQSSAQEPLSSAEGKGKGVVRAEEGEPSSSLLGSETLPIVERGEPFSVGFEDTSPKTGSHLRQVSNISSSASSVMGESGEQGTTDASPRTGSHLRQVSNVSSSASSMVGGFREQKPTAQASSSTAEESMFNFGSLASMIGDEEKASEARQMEESSSPRPGHSRGESSTGVPPNDSK